MLAPLRYDGQMVGALAVHDRLGEVRGFSTDDVQLLQTVANHASVALHNEMLIGRLRHDALHDTLTGLPNRSQLVNEATQPVAAARAHASAGIAVMIIDLNGFKAVNDTLGHHVGDELLREVADRFDAAAGPTASPWPASAATSSPSCVQARRRRAPRMAVATTLLDSLVAAVRRRRGAAAPVRLGRHRAWRRSTARTVGDLLKRADIAMYAAKNGARLGRWSTGRTSTSTTPRCSR